MTAEEFPRGEPAQHEETGPSALLPSVLVALAEEGLTVQDYTRAFSADGVWYGDACGCSDDRCIGFHHDVTDACGCFPTCLEMALDAAVTGLPVFEPGRPRPAELAEEGLTVQDAQPPDQAWQAPDALGVDATAEQAAELEADLGEAGL